MNEGNIQFINALSSMDRKTFIVFLNAVLGASLFASVTYIAIYKDDILKEE